MKKPDKSLIYPLFIPMLGCPGRCIYCDQNKISGASAFDLNAAMSEVQAFIRRNPDIPKEVAFYGGSFTALSIEERENILGGIGEVIDSHTTLRISTHPLYIDQEILQHCRKHRIATIELGIQDWHDAVLTASGRGYSASEAYASCRLIQNNGFRLGLQLMPGLPGSSEQSLQFNRQMLSELRPDFLRLYPLIVIKGTRLARDYQLASYNPLSLKEAIGICADYHEFCTPLNIKIIKYGLPSNIDQNEVLAGPYHPAFGELVKQEILIRAVRKEPGKMQELGASEMQLLRAHGCDFLQEVRLENCTNYIIPQQGTKRKEA